MRKSKICSMMIIIIGWGTGCLDDVVADEPEISTCLDPDIERTPLPDVPLVRQTEHLDFYSEGFVCAGTALELERHATFVAETMGVDLRTHIPLVLSAEPPVQCEQSDTSKVVLGCMKWDGAVFGVPGSLYHELSHSVACQLRIKSPSVSMLVEGFAVMFEPVTWASMKSEDVVLTELFARDKPAYSASGHFVRWLFERDGPDTLADLYRTPSGPDEFIETLEDLYGTGFEELEAEYESAPWRWVPLRQCADLPHVERGADGVWRYSAPAMDCEDEGTMGPYLRERWSQLGITPEWELMYQSFTFTVEEEMYFDYTLDDGIYGVDFELCPEDHEVARDDWGALGGAMNPKTENGGYGVPHLCPGTWRANVLKLHGSTEATEIAFWHDPNPLLPLGLCD